MVGNTIGATLGALFTSRTSPLLGDSRLRLADDELVHPWTPSDAPIPAEHPLGRNCSLGSLRVSPTLSQTMCLVANDWVSNSIKRHGSWRDCNMLLVEWEQAGRNPQNAARKLPDIFLDAGANIGACTLEMLLRTDARIVAFEPNPNNLCALRREHTELATHVLS